MRLSRLFFCLCSRNPSEAQIVSHRCAAGRMIKHSPAGIISWLPLALKCCVKE